jgi:high-affinity nickel-transport protein
MSTFEAPADSHSLNSDRKWSLQPLLRHAERSHSKMPGIRKIPLRAIGIIAFIALINIIVWVAAAIVLSYHPSLVSTAALAYSLGLRHAFDADHISAIDLMTRRLLATGQKPVTVGTFFSLGHSTIVIITSIVVAATAAAVSSRFDSFSTIGGIIGSSVSAAFLILLGIMNAYILFKLIKQMQKVFSLPDGQEDEAWKIEGGGILFSVLKKMFKLIDRYFFRSIYQYLMLTFFFLDRGRCTPLEFFSALVSIPRPKSRFLEFHLLKQQRAPPSG